VKNNVFFEQSSMKTYSNTPQKQNQGRNRTNINTDLKTLV